ncbi:hypothetical protein GJW-30_1_03411 [Variibacter gotjawalensis]|uniref:DUF2029 domain-containing protein n=1 Tax=Variibacter gotjawalensis TaxID=1333996 RepID=A0A0S3PY74_9BRAD|nr:glycosyltransferase family 87 protein [Variibacter gotjawalensis]NIK46696.1 hypothetical protein [Variibacter gotjawalensis]RZS48599.1 uncharacterized protein DUF2029 [Variibacter gotjawalensis]BAT60861.1 hypothetical protein GJW-30_1_03411 [Variibacter gotjawalensis]
MRQNIELSQGAGIPHANVVEHCAAIFALVLVIFFAAAPFFGVWILDEKWQNQLQDFLAFYSAGQQALGGQAGAIYVPDVAHAAQELALGRAFKGQYPWYYPPFYNFLLIPLALIPYGIAYAVWAVGSIALYIRVVGGIVGHRIGYLLALAFPGVFYTALTGQNGALTAALLAGSMTLMRTHPVAAGACLGLLTYKPHFGILVPLALIAGKQWRVMASAVVTTIALVAVSWLVFGTSAWQGFFSALTIASDQHIANGSVKWHKIQSLYAFLRMLGASQTVGLAAHAALLAALALAVWRVWRSDVSFNLKAALLTVAVPLATPYLMIYDGIVLAVPMAFLIREGRETGFRSYEWAVMGIACVTLAVLPFIEAMPSLYIVSLMIGALVVRRLLAPVEMPQVAARV